MQIVDPALAALILYARQSGLKNAVEQPRKGQKVDDFQKLY